MIGSALWRYVRLSGAGHARAAVTKFIGWDPVVHHLMGPTCSGCHRNLSTSPSPQVLQPPVANYSYPIFGSQQSEQTQEFRDCSDDEEYSSRVSPAVQVFAVSVHTDDETEGPFEIYGSIRATEEGRGRRSFSLYNRDPTDPEIIFEPGNLSLSSSEPKHSFISCSLDDTTTKMELYLKDRARDIEVANGQLILHSMAREIEESCDKLIKAFVQGEHGFAFVYYIIFRFAVVANLTVKIFGKSDASSPLYDIHGSIFAGYANPQRYCSNDEEIRYMTSTLFRTPSDHPVQATVDSPITLSRSVVVVPAYSCLIVEANLWNSQSVFACGSVKFTAHDFGDFTKFIHGEKGVISVEVSWIDTFTRLLEGKSPVACTKEIKEKGGDVNERDLVLGETQRVSSIFSPFGFINLFANTPAPYGYDFVEVFSAYVAGFTSDVSVLCGRIVLNDSHDQCLYERDLNNPELLSADKCIASMESHRILNNTHFSVNLHLKDPVRDLEVCNGSFGWNPMCLDYYSLFDKRLCSVVRGEHGFAAVHYIVFDAACEAQVEISFFFANDTPPASVYGCICARYGSHSYSTAYENRYFKSRLFDKPPAEALQLSRSTQLPLFKSVVAVPTDSSLIIEADLRATSVGNADSEAVCGMAAFEIDLSDTSRVKIQGVHYGIEVSVQFEDK